MDGDDFCYNKIRRKENDYWVHRLNMQRIKESQFYLKRAKLRAYQEKFLDFYRMSINSFDKLQMEISTRRQ